MNFTVAFNGDESFLDKLPQSDVITEMFGVHPFSEPIIGNGRTFSHKKTKLSLEAMVGKLKEKGIGFNYLLNSSCIAPIYRNGGHETLFVYIDQLITAGIAAVTLADPFLIGVIKKNFPNLKIYASIILQVDTAEKAKYYESLGVNKIVVCWNINRDFKTLKSIRNNISIEMEILANDWCLLECPYRFSHYNASSHISVCNDEMPFEVHQYYETLCTLHRLNDISHLIRTPWIRPEDMKIYKDLGINSIKITERTASTEWNLKNLNTYLSNVFRGNLWDLITDSSDTEWITGYNISDIFYVDNKALDGFLEFFIDGHCKKDCLACNYCSTIANKVITYTDRKLYEKAIVVAKAKLNSLLLDIKSVRCI